MAKDVSIWVKVRDGFSNSLKRAKDRFRAFAQDVLLSGKGIAIGFAAIAAGVIKSAQAFDDFNKQMSRVEGLLGGVKATELRNEIKGLSAEIGTAKKELVDGLYNALSAGVPQNNVIEFLRTSAKAAAVDGSSLSVVVDGITTVINSFGLETHEAEKAANAMFATVAKGKTTMFELSSSLAQVAPLAASSGVSFNEIFGALANMTSQGTKTAQAVTQIRAAITAANKVLKDGWSASMTLNEAFAEMAKRANGSNTELKKLVGTDEGLLAILAQTGDNAESAAAAFSALGKEAASLDAIFEGTTKNSLAFERLFNALGNTVLMFGENNRQKVVPAVDKLSESIQGFNDKIQNSPESIDNLTKSATKLLTGGLSQLPAFLAKIVTETNRVSESATAAATAAENFTPPTNAVENILKDIAALEDRAAADKKAKDEKRKEAARQFALDIAAAETQLQKEQQAVYDAEVEAFLEKEEQKKAAARKSAKARKTAELEALAEVKEKEAKGFENKADRLLFKNLTPAFAERFEGFKQRRDARKEAERESQAIKRRFDRLQEKQERGIKLNKSDAKFVADVQQFRKAEAQAKQLREKADKQRAEMVQLLKDNLKASGGPA